MRGSLACVIWPKVAAPAIMIWIHKLSMVERIEEFGAEFDGFGLSKFKCSPDREIKIIAVLVRVRNSFQNFRK